MNSECITFKQPFLNHLPGGLFVLVVLLFFAACSSPTAEIAGNNQDEGSVPEEPGEFVRQRYPDLTSNLVLLYSDENEAQTGIYKTLLDSLWTNRSFFSRWVTQEITSFPLSELSHDAYQDADIMIALVPVEATGSFPDSQEPVSLVEQGISFLDNMNLEQDDVVILGQRSSQDSIPDTFVLAANNLDDLERYLPFMQADGYHVFRDGKRVITGNWQRGIPEWKPEPEDHRSLFDEITSSRETGYFRYHNHQNALPKAAFDRFIERTEAKFERISAFLGVEPDEISPADYFLYDRFEDKGLYFGAFFSSFGRLVPDVKHVDVFTQEVHRAVGDEIDRYNWHQDVDPIVYQVLGTAPSSFIQSGLSMYLSEGWHNEGYTYWAARLYHAEQIPELTELLDDDSEAFLSPLMQEALAGSFVRFLMEQWGKEHFLKQYPVWQPDEEDVIALEKEWRATLDQQYSAIKMEVERQRTQFPGASSFQKGFTYAPSPGRNGYLTKSSDASLARLHHLGVDAVALIPYGFTRIDQPTVITPERRMNGEHDAAMVHAILDAKRLGQTVMLKPQLQTRGGWVGEIAMQSEADWDMFYTHFERWMSHYAMMAELYGVEILCIGTELVKATEDEERWIALVNKIRKLYSGELVYASNWGEEFERLSFWSHFDYIGLDNYYPLSEADTVSDAALIEAATKIAKQIETVSLTYNRPVLFTEMGFAATTTPWKQPHETRGERDLAGISQSRGYDAWFNALHGEPWVAGFYWWKWFSHDPQVNRSIDFTPQRKRTEEVIEAWYSEEWADPKTLIQTP